MESVFEVVITVIIWESTFTVIFSVAKNGSNLETARPWDYSILLHECTRVSLHNAAYRGDY